MTALAIARLVKFGWLVASEVLTDQAVQDALRRYAQFFRLLPGSRDVTEYPDTLQAHLLQPRCGCRDVRSASDTLSRWEFAAERRLRVSPGIADLPLSPAITSQAVEDAIAAWAAVTSIAFVPSALTEPCNIRMRAGKIDGAGAVLAWSEMPQANAPNASLYQLYDAEERWTASLLRAVIAHELGHALGLEHSSNPADLMYPIANPAVCTPQAGDVAEAQKRYPPVPPPPPTKTNATLTVSAPLPPGTYELYFKR